MAIERFYQDLTLTKATMIVNAYGVEVETTTDSTIQGVINNARSSEIEYAKARNINVDYHAYLEVTDTTKAITKNDYINGYRIVATPKNTLNRDHHIRVLLEDVI